MISRITRYIFFAVLFSIISFFPEPIHAEFTIINLVFMGVFLSVFLLEKQYRRVFLSLNDWPLWVLVLFLLSGCVMAKDYAEAVNTYIYIAIFCTCLYYIGKCMLFDQRDIKIVFGIICICAFAVSIIGLIELGFGKNVIYENHVYNPYYIRYSFPDYYRTMSTQLNPVVLGTYLLGCLPFISYFTNSKNLFVRFLSILGTIVVIWLILSTFSRGVFLGLIAMAFFYLIAKKYYRFTLILAMFLILLVSAASYSNDSNISRFGFKRFILGSSDSIISPYRFDRVQMAQRMLKNNILFGIGYQHFRIRFDEFCKPGDQNTPHEFKIADNMYLTLLAETGIVGFSGFLIFTAVLFKRWAGQFRQVAEERKGILLVPMMALTALLVNMMAYELFYWHSPFMFFCLIIGFINFSANKNCKIN